VKKKLKKYDCFLDATTTADNNDKPNEEMLANNQSGR